jgi:peroxin-19
MLKGFSHFLSENEGAEGEFPEFKEAMESAFKEVLSRKNLYEPMKNLKEAYPKWLEDNWESLSQSDLERYNKQEELISKICVNLEQQQDSSPDAPVSEEVFELMS